MKCIDFGEPEDKRWERDLSLLLRKHPEFRVTKNTFSPPVVSHIPWEEHEHVKQAIYATQMNGRYKTLEIKNFDWLNQRLSEIERLRKVLYATVLRAIAESIISELKRG